MKIIVSPENSKIKKGASVLIFMFKDGQAKLPQTAADLLENIDISRFRSDGGEVLFVPVKGVPGVILCGLGKSDDCNSEVVRNAAASAVGLCRSRSLTDLSVFFPENSHDAVPGFLGAMAEGLILSNYSFNKYRSVKKDEPPKDIPVESAVIHTGLQGAQPIISEVLVICSNTLLCRDLVNEISDRCGPDELSAYAVKISKDAGIECKIYEKRELQKMGMNLLLAVNRGSTIPARLAVLKYTGAGPKENYTALVGKGLTFDSGGVNLKPSGHIETMRMDMAGAAAVIHAIKAAAELKLKVNLYAVVPMTENLLSRDSYRPGDIFTSYSGKTVEIGNTDAEGRLILADAIAFTEKNLKPEYIIDAATLTGACVLTFGEITAGYLSNDDKLADALQSASDTTGEAAWRLPLYPGYEDFIKSDVADIINISVEKNAGTIIGAVFLKQFIEKAKWAHIDIAGTAWNSKPRGYRPKNATGFGVRLILETVKNLYKK
jgi:leucyl aminopeptidase